MTLAVSVIVPVYRDWERLVSCLEALARQTLPLDRFEIIVANNEARARPLPPGAPPNARIVHEPTPGSYAARNAAVAAASGRYLAFTDSDCVPEPDWLENGTAALEANPEARVTGPVRIFSEPGVGRYALAYDRHLAFPQREFVARGTCVTANLMVERSVFDRVGPFDLRFSGGDLAWNSRAQAAGVPILFREEVAVGHPARRSVRDILRKKRRAAGSLGRGVSLGRLALEAVKPPVRRVMMLRSRGVGWKEAVPIFAILWLGRAVRLQEAAFVRWGLKKPNRS
jgi:GT2 family glycosyltransferase